MTIIKIHNHKGIKYVSAQIGNMQTRNVNQEKVIRQITKNQKENQLRSAEGDEAEILANKGYRNLIGECAAVRHLVPDAGEEGRLGAAEGALTPLHFFSALLPDPALPGLIPHPLDVVLVNSPALPHTPKMSFKLTLFSSMTTPQHEHFSLPEIWI